MTQSVQDDHQTGWLEIAGVPQILRTLGFAIDPVKLGLALVAILLTLLLGTILDFAWKSAGVTVDASIAPIGFAGDVTVTEQSMGIFEYVRQQEMHALLSSSANPLEFLLNPPGQGVAWMMYNHTLYFIIFILGSLLIWSVLGGAITRMTALQCTRDEKPAASDALYYARQNLIGGYFLSPFIPLGFMGVVALLMIIGGLFLRLPVVGDIICGLAFPLAIIGGLVITGLYIGVLVGGSLLFPAVSTDGSDAFDAFSRSMSYVFTKPWKTILYGAIAFVFGSVCWWFFQFFLLKSLAFTQSLVSWGTAPFGWWERAEGVSKLQMIWPTVGSDLSFRWPDWSQLAWYESVSAAMVGVCVLLTVLLAWSFLCSYYFSASTVVYVLLRRDVDGTDTGDVFVEEPGEPGGDLSTDFDFKSDEKADDHDDESKPEKDSIPKEDAPVAAEPETDTSEPAKEDKTASAADDDSAESGSDGDRGDDDGDRGDDDSGSKSD